MTEISVTITCGEGSEKHNHDLEYRSTLKHVHDRPEGVIELIPYRDYKTQINEALKPYIDEYNEGVAAREAAAWERYRAGEIKTKPRKRDYKRMGYDYVADHIDDEQHNPRTGKTEKMPMWRSLILGIGDREDRHAGRITEEQARCIFAEVVNDFRRDFPDFLLLGATIHLDEEGFYHMHLDYKPLYEKEKVERGLSVGIGQDAALERMGYSPEQSIVNGRDKVPILFNAFRNKLYYRMEAAMTEQGLRLQYGVSQVKEPGKDASRNQALETWQATQDAAREMQHQKNIALDIINGDEVSPKELADAMLSAEKAMGILRAVEASPRTVTRNGYKITFNLLSQLKSFVSGFVETMAKLIREVKSLRTDLRKEVERNVQLEDAVDRGVQRCEELQATIGRYADENHELKRKVNQYSAAAAENRQRKEYMSSLTMGGKPLEEKFLEHKKKQQSIEK